MDRDSYGLILAPAARRALTHHLPDSAAFAAWELISGPLIEAPRRVGTPLNPPSDGGWRARRGEYQIRYEIDDADRTVRILDIDHRCDAYRA
ncbi:MAG: type II toxin-antitoxin system RelE/ParE family toxin [Acidimicrobiales bacterium]